ncbi:DH domain-containing protein [Mycena venus]|uniref:DH domain-containing protein n=1 Tax=Mycena venus TaxID=2733690 RepID=A0A8H6XSZ7_9AGAR|nr:DH domain-containing protein [Mycena venus]
MMESDCVPFQTSLVSSNESVRSLLVTPELTPPSSCGSEDSCFSALSSHNSDSLHPTVGIQRLHGSTVDSPVYELGLLARMEFPSKIPISLPSSPTRRPRKLRKPRPCVPKLSLDSSVPGSSKLLSSPVLESLDQRPLLTSPIIPHRLSSAEPNVLKRSRRSSLPSISPATFAPHDEQNIGELNEESCEDLRAVRFVTPRGSNSKPIRRQRSPHPTTLTRNASTHALVSLAWTGQIPSSIWSHSDLSSASLSTPGSESLGSARSTWSDGDEEHTLVSARPRTVIRQRSSSLGHNRRRTLATAITSDEITDEMFVDEVERMRMTFWETRDSRVDQYISSPRLKHALPVPYRPSPQRNLADGSPRSAHLQGADSHRTQLSSVALRPGIQRDEYISSSPDANIHASINSGERRSATENASKPICTGV